MDMTMRVSDETKKKLALLKERLNASSLEEVVNLLMKTKEWRALLMDASEEETEGMIKSPFKIETEFKEIKGRFCVVSKITYVDVMPYVEEWDREYNKKHSKLKLLRRFNADIETHLVSDRVYFAKWGDYILVPTQDNKRLIILCSYKYIKELCDRLNAEGRTDEMKSIRITDYAVDGEKITRKA